jgi:hypothetical protein
MTLLRSIMEYWLNIPYLIILPRLNAYLGRLSGLFNHLNYFKTYFRWWHVSRIDRMKNNGKIYFLLFTVIISIIVICDNLKNYTMTKLWKIISHMSFMINEWNVSHHGHIIVPYHVLNDYCLQQFVHNDFRIIYLFIFMTIIPIINLVIYLKIFFSE